MFERIGRKLVKGAKAEILEPSEGFDWDKALDALVKIAEAGLFIAALAGNWRKPAVTIHNHNNVYITKGE